MTRLPAPNPASSTSGFTPERTPQITIIDRDWLHPDSIQLRHLQQAEIIRHYDGASTEPGTPPSAGDVTLFVIAYLPQLDPPVESSSTEETSPGSELETSPASKSETPGSPSLIPIACGGLRVLSPTGDGQGEVEIKRMFVHPEYRGQPWSAGKAVLAALEERAVQHGWTRIMLETGDRLHAAQRFYQREGYEEIPGYGAYAASQHSKCFGKTLPGNKE